jgi:hypothetical protein
MNASCKRVRDDNDSYEREDSPKRHRSQQPWLPTPAPTATSPTHGQFFLQLSRRKGERKRHQESEPSWFTKHWVTEGGDVSSIECAETIGEDDQMSLPENRPDSAVSERYKVSSPLYRGALKMNAIVIDNSGRKIPDDVRDFVNKHIRKARTSPGLEEEEQDSIVKMIEEIWDSPEATISDIIKPPLFPITEPALAQGRDLLWSSRPLPQNPEYPLVKPKTDRHLGFPPTLKSNWSMEELAAADHSKVRPCSQPTRENIFPSFLIEVKSEASGGTLYAAEGQLATAGAYRVRSLMWILDQVDPDRIQSSRDALIFSAAVSQRDLVTHVHYFNPQSNTFYMSYIDSFHLMKDTQGCRDYVKNVVEWLLEIQQPLVRETLTALHPITKTWKNARTVGAITDAESSVSGRSSKNQRQV